jgi:hypothetical protein
MPITAPAVDHLMICPVVIAHRLEHQARTASSKGIGISLHSVLGHIVIMA